MLEQSILTHSPKKPDDELKRLRERVEEQTALIKHLRERIRELEARLAKDSHNSSRPPSSDSPFKKTPPRSQRQPSGRKPSGQPGRRGVTRSLIDHPDQCVIIPLTGTCACGRCGTGIAATVLAERRQVVERSTTIFREIRNGVRPISGAKNGDAPEPVLATRTQHRPAYGLLPSSQTWCRGPGCERLVGAVRWRTHA